MKALQLVCPHCGAQVAVVVTADEARPERAEGRGERSESREPRAEGTMALPGVARTEKSQGPSLRERTEPGYSGPPGQPPGPKVEQIGGKWYIDCPKHGSHAAREWEAKGRAPACVKCTAGDDSNKSGYCSVQTPLEIAGRWLRWLESGA